MNPTQKLIEAAEALEWGAAPARIEFGNNPNGWREALLPLGKDNTLRLYAEWEALHLVPEALREAVRGLREAGEPVATVVSASDFEGRVKWWRAGHQPQLGTKLYAAPPSPALQPDTVPVPTVVSWSGGAAPYRFVRLRLDDTPTEYEYVPAPQPAQGGGEVVADDYGSTDFGFTFAGLPITDGDKRLAALLTKALGNDHPAFDDLVALLFAARGATRATPPTTKPAAEAGVVEALLAMVADIAHSGGLIGLSEGAALTAIRRLTLDHWVTSGTPEDHKHRAHAATAESLRRPGWRA